MKKPYKSLFLSSVAKNLSERPFTEFILSEGEGFRVTTLVCQSYEVWFSTLDCVQFETRNSKLFKIWLRLLHGVGEGCKRRFRVSVQHPSVGFEEQRIL